MDIGQSGLAPFENIVWSTWCGIYLRESFEVARSDDPWCSPGRRHHEACEPTPVPPQTLEEKPLPSSWCGRSGETAWNSGRCAADVQVCHCASPCCWHDKLERLAGHATRLASTKLLTRLAERYNAALPLIRVFSKRARMLHCFVKYIFASYPCKPIFARSSMSPTAIESID